MSILFYVTYGTHTYPLILKDGKAEFADMDHYMPDEALAAIASAVESGQFYGFACGHTWRAKYETVEI